MHKKYAHNINYKNNLLSSFINQSCSTKELKLKFIILLSPNVGVGFS